MKEGREECGFDGVFDGNEEWSEVGSGATNVGPLVLETVCVYCVCCLWEFDGGKREILDCRYPILN